MGTYKVGDPICDPNEQEYLSPCLASDETLKKFPTTRIMVPTNDALRDESFQFALRLAKQGVDVKVREYDCMPHGFLNYNAPLLGMREESNVTIH